MSWGMRPFFCSLNSLSATASESSPTQCFQCPWQQCSTTVYEEYCVPEAGMQWYIFRLAPMFSKRKIYRGFFIDSRSLARDVGQEIRREIL